MKVSVRTLRYSPDEIRRELEESLASEKKYFDLMYQTLQFTFGAIIAVSGFGFTFFTSSPVSLKYCSLLFSYVLPACLYIFGILYAYNAYALTLCGKRSEILHRQLYIHKKDPNPTFDLMMKKHVISNPYLTIIASIASIGCYMLIPIASISFSCAIYSIEAGARNLFYYHILPVLILWGYYICMIILIASTGSNHFGISKVHSKQ